VRVKGWVLDVHIIGDRVTVTVDGEVLESKIGEPIEVVRDERRTVRRACPRVRRSARLVALVAGLVACNSAADDETIALRMTPGRRPRRMRSTAPIVREFERRHPGVTRRQRSVTNQAEYREKIITSIASARRPTSSFLDLGDTPSFVDAGVVLEPRALRQARGPRSRGLLSVGVGDVLALGGGICLSQRLLADGVLLQPRAVRPGGIPYPKDGWTRDEFLDAARG
jgi:hypothetical protein